MILPSVCNVNLIFLPTAEADEQRYRFFEYFLLAGDALKADSAQQFRPHSAVSRNRHRPAELTRHRRFRVDAEQVKRRRQDVLRRDGVREVVERGPVVVKRCRQGEDAG